MSESLKREAAPGGELQVKTILKEMECFYISVFKKIFFWYFFLIQREKSLRKKELMTWRKQLFKGNIYIEWKQMITSSPIYINGYKNTCYNK